MLSTEEQLAIQILFKSIKTIDVTITKMSSNSGECFVVLPPFTESSEVLYGRNSYRPDGEVSEVLYSDDKEKVCSTCSRLFVECTNV